MRYVAPHIELSYVLAPSDDIDLIAALSLWKHLEIGINQTRRDMAIAMYFEHLDHLFTRYSDSYSGGEDWDNPRRLRECKS